MEKLQMERANENKYQGSRRVQLTQTKEKNNDMQPEVAAAT